ncbi:MAG: hypothetical protein NVS2B12_41860 [Ktedonobacteraceae bacterium]
MRTMSGTPIVECKYGWGQVLRLYYDGLDVRGVFYPLSDLVQVYPMYRQVLCFSSARLELQFTHCNIVIPGIADMPLAQKIVDYITRWNAVTQAMSANQSLATNAQPALKVFPPAQDAHAAPTAGYLWTYDPNDMLPSATIVPTEPMPIMPRSGLQPDEAPQSLPPTVLTDAEAVEPWPTMPASEREHRLKRLRAERELHIYGFDVQALTRRLYAGPLPLVLASLRLLAGETAHYSTEANLCAEPDPPLPGGRRRVKDRGKLILTNKRLIYLGQKRQVILEYAKFLQVSRVQGAVAISIEDVPVRQLFEVRRPLECALYLKRLLEDTELSQHAQIPVEQLSGAIPSLVPRHPPVAYDGLYTQLYPSQGRETIELSLDQLR